MYGKPLERHEFLFLIIGFGAEVNNGRKLKSRVRLMRLVYLAQKEATDAVKKLTGTPEPYEFTLYYYLGPQSEDVQKDVELLQEKGLIIEEKEEFGPGFLRRNYILTDEGLQKFKEITENSDPVAINKLRTIIHKYAKYDIEKLIYYVSIKYINFAETATV